MNISNEYKMFGMDGVNALKSPQLENSTTIPITLSVSPNSANGSDMFLYDDSSMSDGSLYASDQENLSTPRKRYLLWSFDKYFTDKFILNRQT